MVFQNGGLLSHRDVLGNVAYGLEVRGVGKEERENKAMEMINMVGLTGYEHEKLSSLSGGGRLYGYAQCRSHVTPSTSRDAPHLS